MRYYSLSDELAFFAWLKSSPGVIEVRGEGRQLLIHLKSNRLSASSLREFIALYKRYDGNLEELARFETPSNTSWFRDPKSYWYKSVFP